MKADFTTDLSPTPLHYLVFVLQQSSDELLQREAGVSLSHVRIMGALDYLIPASQRAVASSTHQTEANISRQLLVMARLRLVKIVKNKKDARQRDVTLTAKGKRKYDQAEMLLQKQQKNLLKKLSLTEKRSFEESLNKLITGL